MLPKTPIFNLFWASKVIFDDLEACWTYLCADMPSLSESKLYVPHMPSLELRLARHIKIGFLASKGLPFLCDTGL